jgi:hypothetical protein
MSKIRDGLNKRNIDYWKNKVFIKYHSKPEEIAELFAYKVCSEQEIIKLKERIIKIEKILTKYETSKK